MILYYDPRLKKMFLPHTTKNNRLAAYSYFMKEPKDFVENVHFYHPTNFYIKKSQWLSYHLLPEFKFNKYDIFLRHGPRVNNLLCK